MEPVQLYRPLAAAREFRLRGLPRDEDTQVIADLMHERVAEVSSAFIVNRPMGRAVAQLERGGPFRSIWDASGGAQAVQDTWDRADGYMSRRALREQQLGFARGTVYGSLNFDEPGRSSAGVASYGAVGFVLKKDVRDELTLTYGDSLDDTAIGRADVAPYGQAGGVLVQHIAMLNASAVDAVGGWRALQASDPDRPRQMVRWALEPRGAFGAPYVELQWHPRAAHDRLTLDDVRELRVTYTHRQGFEDLRSIDALLPRLERAAADRGLPVVVTNPERAPA